MRCYYCGNELDTGTTICPYCDTPIEKDKVSESTDVYDSDKVFTMEDWQRKKTVELREDAKVKNDELEERVKSKKRKMDESGQDAAFRDAGVVDEQPSQKKLIKPKGVLDGPELDELIRVLARDKKKEVKDRLKKEK
jgi:uncharacterized Zn finger protein (UPF0148 family)